MSNHDCIAKTPPRFPPFTSITGQIQSQDVFLPNQARLKVACEMGQASSQANDRTDANDYNGANMDNRVESEGKPEKRKKRKSPESVYEPDGLHANGLDIVDDGRGKKRRRKKRKSAESSELFYESQGRDSVPYTEKSKEPTKRKLTQSDGLMAWGDSVGGGGGLADRGEVIVEHQPVEIGITTDEEEVAKEDSHGDGTPMDTAKPVDAEAESAHTLLRLRNNIHHDGPASGQDHDLDDTAAASAQLVSESSPVRTFEGSNKIFHDTTPTTPVIKGFETDEQRSRTRSRSTQSSQSSDDMLPRLDASSQEARITMETNEDASRPFTTRTELPRSTLSLDDIASDDESVAAILQDYQDTMPRPEADPDFQNTTVGDEDSTTQLALDAFEKATAAAAATIAEMPTDHFQGTTLKAQSKKAKKRLKDRSERTPQLDEDSSHATASRQRRQRKSTEAVETGQYGRHQAQVVPASTMSPDEEQPIEPQLTQVGFSVMQLENYKHHDPKPTEPTEPPGPKEYTKPGKLKRLSTRMRKRDNDVEQTAMDRFIYHTPADKVYNIPEPNIPRSIRAGDTHCTAESDLEVTNIPVYTRKKRRLPVEVEEATRTPPSSNGIHSQRNRDYEPIPVGVVTKSGPFTSKESAKIHQFRSEYCSLHEWSEAKFAEAVHSNARNVPKLNKFWSEICELLPGRGRQAIQKFCRRQFHNYGKRGVWKEDEDEMLRQAVAEKGTRWKVVSEMLDRHPEDVRDRWRNYLYNAEKRNTKEWTDVEVRALCKAVGECIWLMREERRQRREWEMEHQGFVLDLDEDAETAELEGLIHWQVVSERMGGARSRLQCSMKWKQLKNAGRADLARTLKKATQLMDRVERGEPLEKEYASKDWRNRQARKKVSKYMKAGDKCDLLEALLRCGAEEESEIRWLVLGKGEEWRSKWHIHDLKAGWDMLKENAGLTEDLGKGYVDVVRQLLTRLKEEESESLEERWVPSANRTSQKTSGTVNGKKMKQTRLSSEFVRSSQDEEEQEEEEEEHEDEEEQEDATELEVSNRAEADATMGSDDCSAGSGHDPDPGEAADEAARARVAEQTWVDDAPADAATEREEEEEEVEDDDARLARQLQLLKDA